MTKIALALSAPVWATYATFADAICAGTEHYRAQQYPETRADLAQVLAALAATDHIKGAASAQFSSPTCAAWV